MSLTSDMEPEPVQLFPWNQEKYRQSNNMFGLRHCDGFFQQDAPMASCPECLTVSNSIIPECLAVLDQKTQGEFVATQNSIQTRKWGANDLLTANILNRTNVYDVIQQRRHLKFAATT